MIDSKYSIIHGFFVSFIVFISHTPLFIDISIKSMTYTLCFITEQFHAIALARGHWGIENGLHWILDVAFREDGSRIRTGHAPTNLGIIRHFALNLIKSDKTKKSGVKGRRKRAGWDDKYLSQLLGI